LEQSVAEAQQTENNVIEFQEWLCDVEAQLTARINNDIDANDIPDDVQVGVFALLFLLCLVYFWFDLYFRLIPAKTDSKSSITIGFTDL